MDDCPVFANQPTSNSAAASLEEKLERGEIVVFPECPFPLPTEDDRCFLLDQKESGWPHKHISYNPTADRVHGFHFQSQTQANRLHHLLHEFGNQAAAWLGQTCSNYASNWRRDRISFRVDEEATRKARLTARNDLLHIDAFPSRPTQGDRILRLFVNLHPSDPRVWVTSDPFARLLERFGHLVGLPGQVGGGWTQRLQQEILGLFQPEVRRRTVYDQFMLRFHNFLKSHDDFQERGPKKFWYFPSGTMWLAFTDTISHADLRGRFLLEHSFFISPTTLALPAEAPAAVLERACGLPVLNHAA